MNDSAYYHTDLDNPAEIDVGSIQQQGDYTLALVRHFGNADLTTLNRDGDAVFFNGLPGRVVAYDDVLALVLAGVATLLVLLILGFGLRRNQLKATGLVARAVTMVAGTVLTTLVVALVWVGIRALNVDYQAILVGSYQTRVIVVALTLLAFACMALLYAALGARFRAIDLAAGAIVIWTLLAWLISVAAPGASYLIWPLLFGLLPLGASLSTSRIVRSPWMRMAVLAVAAIPVFLLLPSTAYVIVAILNRLELMCSLAGSPPLLGIWSLFVAPLASLLILHMDFLSGGNTQKRWIAPALLMLAATGLIAWANVTSGFNDEQPRFTHIAYELNADSGTARWLTLDPELNSWTAQFFPAEQSQEPYEFSAGFERDAIASSAPVADLAAPQAEVLNDMQNGTSRMVEIQLDSPRSGAILDVRIEGAGEIKAAELDGREMDLSDYSLAGEGELRFSYVAIPDEGVTLVLEVVTLAPFSLTLKETTLGLPALTWIVVSRGPRI
ncbi:hypothetical protein BH23CHL5_BH23CHL5_09140 [soil metagenome]